MPDHDLIIVGGGPAGLSTALHLQRFAPALAQRTIVLERERFPREKFCAGGLAGRGVKLLERLGIGIDVPNVPFTGVRLDFPDGPVTVREPGLGCVVRRLEFDDALARAARSRGVALREGAKVESVEETADGVRVHLAGGEQLTARALVGADGVGGVVRRSAGFGGGRLRAQVIELDTERVGGDPAADEIRFDLTLGDLGGYAWDFPTLVGGRELMCRGVYVIRTLGADNVQERLRGYLAARGLDIARYRQKPFGERGLAPGEVLSRSRLMLVGEAAGIDIATGEGIAQALEYGEVAARYLAAAFARGDLQFASWTRAVHRSGLGLSLGARLLAWRLYYFERARSTELFLRSPAILQLYAQHFSGRRLRLRTAGRVLATARLRDLPWVARACLTPREGG